MGGRPANVSNPNPTPAAEFHAPKRAKSPRPDDKTAGEGVLSGGQK
jgi:hypothetical protein